MLSFLPGTQACEADKDRMAALLFATSYLEYCSFGNKLRLPLVALQRRQNIDPYIGFVRVMVDEDSAFAGFFTAATLAEFGQVQAPSYYRDEMQDMDRAYDAFVALHARARDLFVSSLAIEERYRGAGLFGHMLSAIVAEARARGCTRVVLTVWERSSALPVYLAKGFRSCASFDYAWELFFDRLHFLALDLEKA